MSSFNEAAKRHVEGLPSFLDGGDKPWDSIWAHHKIRDLRRQLHKGEIRSFLSYDLAIVRHGLANSAENRFTLRDVDLLRKSALMWLIEDYNADHQAEIAITDDIVESITELTMDRPRFWQHAKALSALVFPDLDAEKALATLAGKVFMYEEIEAIISGSSYSKEDVERLFGSEVAANLDAIKNPPAPTAKDGMQPKPK